MVLLGILDTEHFDNHDVFLVELDKEIKRSQEIFVKHHIKKYEGILPVWVAVEVLSFGALSKLFSNMKIVDQNQIAMNNYRVPAVYLISWLKCLSYIRNICAHYGRLYNRPLTSKPRLDRRSKKMGIDQGKRTGNQYWSCEDSNALNLFPDRIHIF
jgi:abortive infection bacteriophage resistance protein